MGVVGIFHTGLTVSDLDRSVAFYRDVLGLELVNMWDSAQPYLRKVVGDPDDITLEFIQPAPGR